MREEVRREARLSGASTNHPLPSISLLELLHQVPPVLSPLLIRLPCSGVHLADEKPEAQRGFPTYPRWIADKSWVRSAHGLLPTFSFSLHRQEGNAELLSSSPAVPRGSSPRSPGQTLPMMKGSPPPTQAIASKLGQFTRLPILPSIQPQAGSLQARGSPPAARRQFSYSFLQGMTVTPPLFF